MRKLKNFVIYHDENQDENLENSNMPLSAGGDGLSSANARALEKAMYGFVKSDVKLVKTSESSDKSDASDARIDLLFHFSLLQLIISALILLYYIVKNKAKRVIKNV